MFGDKKQKNEPPKWDFTMFMTPITEEEREIKNIIDVSFQFKNRGCIQTHIDILEIACLRIKEYINQQQITL